MKEKIKQTLSSSDKFQNAAELLKMLADESRVKIFWLLCHSEECVIDIASITDMSGPAVSHHLQLLKSAGLIESRRDGKETYYKATDTELSHLLHETLENVMIIACPDDRKSLDPDDIIRDIHDYLNEHLDQKITIDELALQFHLNTTTLKKTFKKIYGMSIAAHVRMHRMEKAGHLLLAGDDSIMSIAAAVGYESQSRFTMVFKNEYGMLPTEYRKTHRK